MITYPIIFYSTRKHLGIGQGSPPSSLYVYRRKSDGALAALDFDAEYTLSQPLFVFSGELKVDINLDGGYLIGNIFAKAKNEAELKVDVNGESIYYLVHLFTKESLVLELDSEGDFYYLYDFFKSKEEVGESVDSEGSFYYLFNYLSSKHFTQFNIEPDALYIFSDIYEHIVEEISTVIDFEEAFYVEGLDFSAWTEEASFNVDFETSHYLTGRVWTLQRGEASQNVDSEGTFYEGYQYNLFQREVGESIDAGGYHILEAKYGHQKSEASQDLDFFAELLSQTGHVYAEDTVQVAVDLGNETRYIPYRLFDKHEDSSLIKVEFEAEYARLAFEIEGVENIWGSTEILGLEGLEEVSDGFETDIEISAEFEHHLMMSPLFYWLDYRTKTSESKNIKTLVYFNLR